MLILKVPDDHSMIWSWCCSITYMVHLPSHAMSCTVVEYMLMPASLHTHCTCVTHILERRHKHTCFSISILVWNILRIKFWFRYEQPFSLDCSFLYWKKLMAFPLRRCYCCGAWRRSTTLIQNLTPTSMHYLRHSIQVVMHKEDQHSISFFYWQ